MEIETFIAQAVIAGKTRAEALALYAVAFPPPPPPAPNAVVAYRRLALANGDVRSFEILGDGSERQV